MSPSVLVSLAGVFFLALGALSYFIFFNQKDEMSNMKVRRNTDSSKKDDYSSYGRPSSQEVFKQGVELGNKESDRTGALTVTKRLKYAEIDIPTIFFHGAEVVISLVSFSIAFKFFDIPLQVVSLISGPLICRAVLNQIVNHRFKSFDRDYPPFILSLVGLLKTGMNPIQAMEAAANGLEETSLVRFEVEQMLERLRLGVPEDKSIGTFAETVYHPEIELFVQALLLSRKVGGTLSDTLERLAKQIRKRQQFRSAAVAAVGLQRGSIYFIIGILISLFLYIRIVFPEMTYSLLTPLGWQVTQGAVIVMGLGIFWVRQVTKLKV